MNQKLDRHLAQDMPGCSYPECAAQSTHLIVQVDTLKIYQVTRDRKDIKLWAGCDQHQSIIAHGVKWQGHDVQVMTARALAHLGELENLSEPETEDAS